LSLVVSREQTQKPNPRRKKGKVDKMLDKALEESFPVSIPFPLASRRQMKTDKVEVASL